MPKLFEAINDLSFEEPAILGQPKEDIKGIIDPNKEFLEFSASVKIRNESIEKWLSKIEEEMYKNLTKKIKTAHHTLNKDFGTDNFSKEEWIFSHCAQAVTVASLIYWTEQTEEAIYAIGEEGDNNNEDDFFGADAKNN